MSQFVSQPTTIRAEQWDGSLAALARIQALISPLSPYRMFVNAANPQPSNSIGVCVFNGAVPTMAWCELYNWVVRVPGHGDAGRTLVLTDEEFRAAYAARGDDANIATTEVYVGEGLRDA